MEHPHCPCKKKTCSRHGNCTECRKDHAEKGRRPRCERTGAKKIGVLLGVLAVMAVLQAVKSMAESIAAPFLPDTRFAAKMLAMSVMLLLTAAVIMYARLRKVELPVFPECFSKWYILCTAAAALLLIAAPSNFTDGFPAVMAAVYGSIVTPVYEELLFRGFIWSRLKPCFKGAYSTCILTAVLFGLWHIGYMIPQLLVRNWFAVGTKAAVGLVYGFVLGFVRLKTKNCYSAMLLHGVMNLFAF